MNQHLLDVIGMLAVVGGGSLIIGIALVGVQRSMGKTPGEKLSLEQEYYRRDQRMNLNTCWFFGAAFIIVGLWVPNIWVILFGAFFLLVGVLMRWRIRRRGRYQKWEQ